jgi:hypothetical protein
LLILFIELLLVLAPKAIIFINLFFILKIHKNINIKNQDVLLPLIEMKSILNRFPLFLGKRATIRSPFLT